MSPTNRFAIAAAVAIGSIATFAPLQQASAQKSAAGEDQALALKNWTCNATIALQGTSLSYAVPNWQMSGGLLVDREKKCRQRVESDWLNNGKIWTMLNIPAEQQNSICQSGGTFRIDYGFAPRNKDWNFTKTMKPNCTCVGGMKFSS